VAGSPLVSLSHVDVQAGLITTTPLRRQQAKAFRRYESPQPLPVHSALQCTFTVRSWPITDPEAPLAEDGSTWAR